MSYPVNLELDAPPEVANWRPLVHWILVFPHALIASVLANVGGVLAFVSWFIILFTGKLPEGIANFQCLVLRYQVRSYSYALWLREAYPPFEFDMTQADPGTDPVRVDLTVALEDRNRLTVGLRFIWIIPVAIFLMVVAVVAWLAMLVAFFAVLFTGRWPDGLRDFVVGVGRLWVRVTAYSYLLVDEYPPFSLD
jgi:hypothetical protein